MKEELVPLFLEEVESLPRRSPISNLSRRAICLGWWAASQDLTVLVESSLPGCDISDEDTTIVRIGQ